MISTAKHTAIIVALAVSIAMPEAHVLAANSVSSTRKTSIPVHTQRTISDSTTIASLPWTLFQQPHSLLNMVKATASSKHPMVLRILSFSAVATYIYHKLQTAQDVFYSSSQNDPIPSWNNNASGEYTEFEKPPQHPTPKIVPPPFKKPLTIQDAAPGFLQAGNPRSYDYEDIFLKDFADNDTLSLDHFFDILSQKINNLAKNLTQNIESILSIIESLDSNIQKHIAIYTLFSGLKTTSVTQNSIITNDHDTLHGKTFSRYGILDLEDDEFNTYISEKNLNDQSIAAFGLKLFIFGVNLQELVELLEQDNAFSLPITSLMNPKIEQDYEAFQADPYSFMAQNTHYTIASFPFFNKKQRKRHKTSFTHLKKFAYNVRSIGMSMEYVTLLLPIIREQLDEISTSSLYLKAHSELKDVSQLANKILFDSSHKLPQPFLNTSQQNLTSLKDQLFPSQTPLSLPLVDISEVIHQLAPALKEYTSLDTALHLSEEERFKMAFIVTQQLIHQAYSERLLILDITQPKNHSYDAIGHMLGLEEEIQHGQSVYFLRKEDYDNYPQSLSIDESDTEHYSNMFHAAPIGIKRKWMNPYPTTTQFEPKRTRLANFLFENLKNLWALNASERLFPETSYKLAAKTTEYPIFHKFVFKKILASTFNPSFQKSTVQHKNCNITQNQASQKWRDLQNHPKIRGVIRALENNYVCGILVELSKLYREEESKDKDD